ncbi:unnamed protein product [Sphagnum compactum]
MGGVKKKRKKGPRSRSSNRMLKNLHMTTTIMMMPGTYNHVQVLEVARRAQHPLAGAQILLLDKPGNIQSVCFPQKALTGSYYDVFTTLLPLLPEGGPVGNLR